MLRGRKELCFKRSIVRQKEYSVPKTIKTSMDTVLERS
jgi:hypothetical protein